MLVRLRMQRQKTNTKNNRKRNKKPPRDGLQTIKNTHKENMSSRTIKQKLKKYQQSYVPGEKRSAKYNNMMRRKTILHENIQLLHSLNQEVPEKLKLNRCDIIILENLLTGLNGQLKTLNRRLSTEQILLIFIFYLNKVEKPQIRIEDYRILKNNQINIYNYSLTISRLCMYLMRNMPLHPIQTTDYDHDLLIRNGGL